MSFNCYKCGTKIPGTNCAYDLSYKKGWKKKVGCYAHCHCGYPVRAKEVRNNIFSGYLNGDKKSNSNSYIYVENNNGQGHVYYGTYNYCHTGNGTTASDMSSVRTFQRYSSAN